MKYTRVLLEYDVYYVVCSLPKSEPPVTSPEIFNPAWKVGTYLFTDQNREAMEIIKRNPKKGGLYRAQVAKLIINVRNCESYWNYCCAVQRAYGQWC